MQERHSIEGLDPVVVVALEDLHDFATRHVLNPPPPEGRVRGSKAQIMARGAVRVASARIKAATVSRRPDLLDPDVRSGAIWIFKDLVRLGHTFEPHLVGRWAISKGWDSGNAQLLRDYATSVLGGIRFHTGPDSFGVSALHWEEEAAGYAADGASD